MCVKWEVNSLDAPVIQRSLVPSQNSANDVLVLWYRPCWRARLLENTAIRWIRPYFSTGALEVNILPRLSSYSSSQGPLSALECDGGRLIRIDNSNLWIAARGRGIICSLTLCKRKITQWNFSKLVTFYRRARLTCPNQSYCFCAGAGPSKAMPLLFTVFRHQPFPISPSGKSQLFVQVPSVIEFAAEIAAWKISFSLPAEARTGACVCAFWPEAHHLLPNWSSSSISQPRCFPTAIQLHFEPSPSRLRSPSSQTRLNIHAISFLLSYP